jgi:hypothetical protein
MSDQQPDLADDSFDFVRECIRTYRMAGDNVEHRIKALALLQKVALPPPSVKDDDGVSNNRAAVELAQQALRQR